MTNKHLELLNILFKDWCEYVNEFQKEISWRDNSDEFQNWCNHVDFCVHELEKTIIKTFIDLKINNIVGYSESDMLNIIHDSRTGMCRLGERKKWHNQIEQVQRQLYYEKLRAEYAQDIGHVQDTDQQVPCTTDEFIHFKTIYDGFASLLSHHPENAEFDYSYRQTEVFENIKIFWPRLQQICKAFDISLEIDLNGFKDAIFGCEIPDGVSEDGICEGGKFDGLPFSSVIIDCENRLRGKGKRILDSVMVHLAKHFGQADSSDELPFTDVDKALEALLHALEKHRLTFLYFALPERKKGLNRGWETIDKDKPELRIPPEEIDNKGEFLFRYKWQLDLFAQKAIGDFGSGQGCKPRTMTGDDKFVDIEGGSYPFWRIDEIACEHLEKTGDAILKACKQLLEIDTTGAYHALSEQAMNVVHDNDQPRWYSSVLVKWEYLLRLDEAIASLKKGKQEIIAIKKSLGELSKLTPEENKYIQRNYLLLFAQAYYALIEAVGSSPVHSMNLELNQYYLWVVKSIKSLLDKPEFNDFPGGFEPLAENLFPDPDSGLDMLWEESTLPNISDFLGRAQAYLMDLNFLAPENEEMVNNIIDFYKFQCEKAIKTAHQHLSRSNRYFNALMDRTKKTYENQTDKKDKESSNADDDSGEGTAVNIDQLSNGEQVLKNIQAQTDNDSSQVQVSDQKEHSIPAIKEPSKIAIAAYRVQIATGKTQQEIADILTKEFKKPVSQGQVSRWLQEVKEYVEAGNVLPDLTKTIDKPVSIDPDVIDIGERRDRLAKRQRPCKSDDD